MKTGEKVRKALKSYVPWDLFDPLLRTHLRSGGTALVLAICAVTLAVWIAQGSDSLCSAITIMAKTSAFLAISFLSLNFMTSTRWSFLEDAFGGLDRQYRVHKVVGKLTLLFIISHLAFLTINAVPSWSRVLALYVPGISIPLTLGIASLIALAILLALTLHVKIPYTLWLITHRLMVVPLLLAVWHALDAGSDVQRYPLLMYWVVLIGTLGVLAYLYTLFLYRRLGPRASMRVSQVRRFPEMTEVRLRPEGKGLAFHPGQFVFVRFPRLNGAWEMWPFSVSSHPSDETMRLSIKKLGDFTGEKVTLVQEGDEAVVMGPYGKFGERYLEHSRDTIWIAGGIGITPFLSMARNEVEVPTGRRIDLIWSFRDPDEEVYLEELRELATRSKHLRFHPWVSAERGRISAEKVAELLGGREEVIGKVIFLCGALPMMESLSRQFVEMGVRMRDVVFEDFNLL